MQFHNYETVYDFYKKQGHRRCDSVAEFYRLYESTFGSEDREIPGNAGLNRMLELDWYSSGRPYYKVWPSIVDSLLTTKLDIPLSSLGTENSVLAIRLQEGVDVPDIPLGTAAICGWYFSGNDVRFVLCCQRRGGLFSGLEIPRSSCEWSISDLVLVERLGREPITDEVMKVNYSFMTLAVALKLLADDPSIIKPDVLSSDRGRYDAEHDAEWKHRAVDRARRRGIFGWRVGEEFEVCPHYRRPHFAIRHTGIGKSIPRIVAVKGSIVHRSKMTKVPTGYLTPDGMEVE